MGCRVGMTTDVERRKREWESKYSTLDNWKILKEFQSKKEAQLAEIVLAKRHGCISHHGGGGDEGDTWFVYKFDY